MLKTNLNLRRAAQYKKISLALCSLKFIFISNNSALYGHNTITVNKI